MTEKQDERRFAVSLTLQASQQQAWAALVDPLALSWMVAQCIYTVAVPPLPGADSELRCWWRRLETGRLVSGVFELVVLEPHRRLRYIEQAQRALLFEVTLERESGHCRVEIAGFWKGIEGAQPVKKLVKRWAKKLPKAALAGAIAPQPSPLGLLNGPGFRPQQLVQEIDIEAPLEAIWAAAEDPDGNLLILPGLIRQWTEPIAATDSELSFTINRLDGPRMTCGLSQVFHHEQHHQTARTALLESEQRLVPHGTGGKLTSAWRWSRRLPVKRELLEDRSRQWLSRVKAVAEAS